MLDADIYGPSQPMMLGITGSPSREDGKTLEPMMGHGMQAMSIGFLIDVDTPMVWRGPMVTQALEQLLSDTNWSDLDYLVVDLPPGTGDMQLTLAQKVPVTGAVIVTTPQDIALHRRAQGPQDVREGRHSDPRHRREHEHPHLLQLRPRGAHLRRRAAPSACARTTTPSSSAGCRSTSRSASRPTRASRPWSPTPTGAVAEIYRKIARRVAVKIAELQKDMSSKFPNIVIQNT